MTDQQDELIAKLTVSQHAWIRWARAHLAKAGLIAQDFVPSNTDAMELMDQLLTAGMTPQSAAVLAVAAPTEVPVGHVFATGEEAVAYMKRGGAISFDVGRQQRCIIASDWYRRHVRDCDWELTDRGGFSDQPGFYTAAGMRADLDGE